MTPALILAAALLISITGVVVVLAGRPWLQPPRDLRDREEYL